MYPLAEDMSETWQHITENHAPIYTLVEEVIVFMLWLLSSFHARTVVMFLVLLAHVATASGQCNHGHTGPSPTPPAHPLTDRRPATSNRTFTSPAVEARLHALLHDNNQTRRWKNPELATLLWNCLPNTLDTTVWHIPDDKDPTTFISTGDIPFMWLRDSQNQITPYLRDAKSEPDGIGLLLRGLLRRHINAVLHDPYANSITFSAEDIACNTDSWLNDNTTMLDPQGVRVRPPPPWL